MENPTATEANSGGPAFPCELPSATSCGMTLRDWFAGQATDRDVEMFIPQTVEESAKSIGVTAGEFGRKHSGMIRVNARYAFADAMLKARGAQLGHCPPEQGRSIFQEHENLPVPYLQ